MAIAWILEEIGNIGLKDVEMPIPEENEVRIQVKAAGICGSDIPRIYETGAHRMPLVPGHEFSGVVEGIGKNVPSYWLGRRVGVYPLIPCRKCEPCMSGKFELCRNYDYIGSRIDGAFAEYVIVQADNLIELPESVSFEEAAMLEPMAVAVNAVRKGSDGYYVQKEKKVTVIGLGTIGLLVTMFLKEAGYENIYVIGNKDGQKERAVLLGIPQNHCLAFGEDLSDASDSAAVFECVGKADTIAAAIGMAGASGRIALVGNPCSDVHFERNLYWKILRNQLTVSGVWNSRFNGSSDDDWHYVLDCLKERRIAPAGLISHRLHIGDLEKGLHIMRDKTEDYCKVMMVME